MSGLCGWAGDSNAGGDTQAATLERMARALSRFDRNGVYL